MGDFNAIAGAATADMTRNLKQHYGYAVDVAVVTPYNSAPATIASPIVKFDITGGNARDVKNVVIVSSEENPVYTSAVTAGVGG